MRQRSFRAGKAIEGQGRGVRGTSSPQSPQTVITVLQTGLAHYKSVSYHRMAYSSILSPKIDLVGAWQQLATLQAQSEGLSYRERFWRHKPTNCSVCTLRAAILSCPHTLGRICNLQFFKFDGGRRTLRTSLEELDDHVSTWLAEGMQTNHEEVGVP